MRELDFENQSEEDPPETLPPQSGGYPSERGIEEYVIHSDDDIVQPVIDIPQKRKRLYKPRIRKDSVVAQEPETREEPFEIPEKLLREIEVLQDPIVELDQRPDPPPPPPPPPPPQEPKKEKKKEPLITCPNCNKEMLNKTYKYYHSLKCNLPPESEKETTKQLEPLKPLETLEPLEVKTKPKHTQPQTEKEMELPRKELQPPSTNRHIQRREFFKNLVKNAF